MSNLKNSEIAQKIKDEQHALSSLVSFREKFIVLSTISTPMILNARIGNVYSKVTGFIRENGKVVAREIAQIPVHEAAMLEANYDLDYLAFSRNNDKAALRRLLQRFPHWRCASGGI